VGSDQSPFTVVQIGFRRLENPFRPFFRGLAGVDLDSIGPCLDQKWYMYRRGDSGLVGKSGYAAENKRCAGNTKNHSIYSLRIDARFTNSTSLTLVTDRSNRDALVCAMRISGKWHR
jgi:hypothetical protein